MQFRPFLLHALSPLHAGTGQNTGVIDLPIARMSATNIPFVPGSSIKGVLRDARKNQERTQHAAVFGPERPLKGPDGDDNTSIDHAGALIVADARLLALPVRSFFGTFALVSSPLLLRLALRDLREAGISVAELRVPSLTSRGARYGDGKINVAQSGKLLYLEELNLPAEKDALVNAWAKQLAAVVGADDAEILQQRFVIVDDETMTFLWETATQVDTRVRINESGVVATGALWTEESLPAETLLIGLSAAHASMRQGCSLSAEKVLDFALPQSGEILQFGGKATIGKGRCRVRPWPAATTAAASAPAAEARRS